MQASNVSEKVKSNEVKDVSNICTMHSFLSYLLHWKWHSKIFKHWSRNGDESSSFINSVLSTFSKMETWKKIFSQGLDNKLRMWYFLKRSKQQQCPSTIFNLFFVQDIIQLTHHLKLLPTLYATQLWSSIKIWFQV